MIGSGIDAGLDHAGIRDMPQKRIWREAPSVIVNERIVERVASKDPVAERLEQAMGELA